MPNRHLHPRNALLHFHHPPHHVPLSIIPTTSPIVTQPNRSKTVLPETVRLPGAGEHLAGFALPGGRFPGSSS